MAEQIGKAGIVVEFPWLRSKTIGRLIAISTAVISGMSVQAALIERDLTIVGDKALTVDSASGLEWLDVSATVGLTVSAVNGSAFVTQLGFRYASETEVETLWRNAGAGGPFQYDPLVESHVANFDAARLLVSMLGCTSNVLGEMCDGIGQNWHVGRFSDQSDAAAPFIEELALVDYFGPPDRRAGTGTMLLDWGSLDPGFFDRADIGNFLVRNTADVAEPASSALAMCGLSMLVVIGRRRLRTTGKSRAATLAGWSGAG